MTRRFPARFAVVATLVFVVLSLLTHVQAQKPASQAELLLGKALNLEDVAGNLKDAIATYEQVLKAPDATRAQKARAQFRIGACYERLGVDGARKAYELLVSQYGDQGDLAAQAKTRLAAMGLPRAQPANTGPGHRQIWPQDNARVMWIQVAPDGGSVVGVDATGDLVVRSLATGETRRLTAIPKDGAGKDNADNPVWSRDGRQIAYCWYSGKTFPELRVAELASGTSRVVPLDSKYEATDLEDWSPDGKRILATLAEKPPARTRHLAWVTLVDGRVELLVSVAANAYLSPDGEWIVYRASSPGTSFMMVPARGGPARVLTRAVGSSALVGWSSDGGHLLSISPQRDAVHLMATRIEGGRVAGEPFLIRKFERFASLGVTRAGALVYLVQGGLVGELYRASFDPVSGAVGPGSRVDMGIFSQNGHVSWSPDGRQLAYTNRMSSRSEMTLSIWSAQSGETRLFTLPFGVNGAAQTTWSADGRWVYVDGRDGDDGAGLFRVSGETGAVEAVLPPDAAIFPRVGDTVAFLAGWSPDGRIVYKKVNHTVGRVVALVEHRISDHAERQLFTSATAAGIQGFGVSPDGTQLAFIFVDFADGATPKLMILPAAGGPTRTIVDLPLGRFAASIPWTPDGRAVLLSVRRQNDKGPEELWLCDVGTGSTRTIRSDSMLEHERAVSPNGKEIAYVHRVTKEGEGVWMLENFLPPAKPVPPAKK